MEENLSSEQEFKLKKIFTPFTIINIFLFFIVILSSFYFFYLKKDFDFIIEIPCDPSLEICTIRDCSNPENCPPNQLESFKRYSLKAYDFNQCPNEDCALWCEGGLIECKKIECAVDEEIGENCSNATL